MEDLKKEEIIPLGTKMILLKDYLSWSKGTVVIASGLLGIASYKNRYQMDSSNSSLSYENCVTVDKKYLRKLENKTPEDWL